eukprot:3941970-Rhodomonas_salina.5
MVVQTHNGQVSSAAQSLTVEFMAKADRTAITYVGTAHRLASSRSISRTGLASRASSLRACYVMPGTELSCAATRSMPAGLMTLIFRSAVGDAAILRVLLQVLTCVCSYQAGQKADTTDLRFCWTMAMSGHPIFLACASTAPHSASSSPPTPPWLVTCAIFFTSRVYLSCLWHHHAVFGHVCAISLPSFPTLAPCRNRRPRLSHLRFPVLRSGMLLPGCENADGELQDSSTVVIRYKNIRSSAQAVHEYPLLVQEYPLLSILQSVRKYPYKYSKTVALSSRAWRAVCAVRY